VLVVNKLRYFLACCAVALKTWIYRNNVFGLCTTFNAYKGGGTTVSIAKNSDHMLLTITSAYGWAYSAEQIDLTDYKTLYFYGYHTGASTMKFDIQSGSYTTYSSTAEATIPGGSVGLVSIDVSSYNGAHYVRFGRIVNSNATDTIYCYLIYLVK
jgi:hypothetical protein